MPGKSSLCEWKGRATYWNIKLLDTNEEVKSKIWSYESPTPPFKDIKGYLSIYASGVPWECYVDDEKAQPQEGTGPSRQVLITRADKIQVTFTEDG